MGNKVMVIDDDKEFLEEVSEVLKSGDYDVETVSDSGMALDRVIESKPDIILLDLRMPDEDGLQVARKIQYFPALKKIPIIAVTGYVNARDRSLMKNYGICSCLTKPVDSIDLLLNLDMVL